MLCGDCGLFRVADDYPSGQARGQAHTAVTGHRQVHCALIDPPERIKVAQAFEAWSEQLVRDDVEESFEQTNFSDTSAVSCETLVNALTLPTRSST